MGGRGGVMKRNKDQCCSGWCALGLLAAQVAGGWWSPDYEEQGGIKEGGSVSGNGSTVIKISGCDWSPSR